MKKRVAILQSNYIPWKGYFDLLASVDEFIVYDEVQYTKNDWRNRNKVKTPQGTIWLTIPVITADRFGQTIKEAEINGTDWAERHWQTIRSNYLRAPYFTELERILLPIYEFPDHSISNFNVRLIKAVANYLHLTTKISDCMDFGLIDGKTERLVDLCKKANATTYVSGPAAKNYLDERLFKEAGIDVDWFDYSGYREYPQLWGGFEHAVSIIDLLLNCGKSSGDYMKYVPPV